jgi:glutamate racemase
VIGTVATITSGAYEDAFAAAAHVHVTSAACPRFVDFVERGATSGRQLLGLAQAYLEPLIEADVDTLVLGCTHYPLLQGVLAATMGDGVTLISSADETAKDVYKTLAGQGIERDEALPEPEHVFLSTGDPAWFAKLARRFLGPDVGQVRQAVPA